MERASVPVLHPALLPAGTVLGRWRVVAWGGQGVHGAVHRAVRVGQEQAPAVALKLALLPEAPRFTREAELLSRLRLQEQVLPASPATRTTAHVQPHGHTVTSASTLPSNRKNANSVALTPVRIQGTPDVNPNGAGRLWAKRPWPHAGAALLNSARWGATDFL